jgi:hypothetical protein
VRSKVGKRSSHIAPYLPGKLCDLNVPKFRLAGLSQMQQWLFLYQQRSDSHESGWFWKLTSRQPIFNCSGTKHTWWAPTRMDFLICTEYSFLAGCLQDNTKSQISEGFAPIAAFRITRIHPNRGSGYGETAIAVVGSKQTDGILKHSNDVIYLVSRVPHGSPAYQLSNTPTLEKVCWELDEKWSRQSGASKMLSFNYF